MKIRLFIYLFLVLNPIWVGGVIYTSPLPHLPYKPCIYCNEIHTYPNSSQQNIYRLKKKYMNSFLIKTVLIN